MACCKPKHRRELFERGAPERVVTAMEVHKKDYMLQELACWALGCMTGLSMKRARQLLEIGAKGKTEQACAMHYKSPNIDDLKKYASAVNRRIEATEEDTVQSADMPEDEEDIEDFESEEESESEEEEDIHSEDYESWSSSEDESEVVEGEVGDDDEDKDGDSPRGAGGHK
eukprot:TRINITY_DN112693_c0_g1_i1.p1 TRINITY_DN112693_c0_g1~~TRINITY_DN112693_c0_g1_i1.p1  ORF type:complete len:193 (+),score=48.01 TRINITY_DN112693_c0_g1_i1:67-579(+)